MQTMTSSSRRKAVSPTHSQAARKVSRQAVIASNDDAGHLLAAPMSGIDLDRYVPAYFVWIANKLTRGASQNYLNLFGV